jgi:RHS repeat-associated protein
MVMPGKKYGAASRYRYGFNGKEDDNDISEGGQDYGMRIYDSRLGRFLSVDPLTDEYPELTPYQFASNRPIDGIDLDGTEWSKAQLEDILAKAKAALGTLATESAIVLRGSSNAFANANSMGISDHLWGFLCTDNLDDYSTDYDKSLYLNGRILGDVAAAFQGAVEVSGGLGAAAAAGKVAFASGGTTTVGSGITAIGALAVAGHGALNGKAAAEDLAWSLKKLAGLNGAVDASKSAQPTPQQNTNDQSTSAHSGSTESAQSNTASNKKFNGQKDTKSSSKRESFNKAKDQNGIPRSQQPDRTVKIREMSKGEPTGKTLREYQYTNSQGKKVSIRRDNPTRYNEGGVGDQGKHHNAGETGGKLRQHHNY